MKIYVWKYNEDNELFFSLDRLFLDDFSEKIKTVSNDNFIKFELSVLPENSPHYIDDESSFLPRKEELLPYSFKSLFVKVISNQKKKLITSYEKDKCFFNFSVDGITEFNNNIKSATLKGSFIRFNSIEITHKSDENIEYSAKLRILGTHKGKPIFM